MCSREDFLLCSSVYTDKLTSLSTENQVRGDFVGGKRCVRDLPMKATLSFLQESCINRKHVQLSLKPEPALFERKLILILKKYVPLHILGGKLHNTKIKNTKVKH